MRAKVSNVTQRRWLACIPLVLVIVAPCVVKGAEKRSKPSGSRAATGSGAREAVLRHEIERSFRLNRFTVQELSVRADGAGCLTTSVTIDDEPYTLSLQPSVVRAPSFRVLVDDGSGKPSRVTPPPPRTYRGTLVERPGSVVAASLDNGQLKAVIRFGNEDIWAVQPVTDAVPTAKRSWHLVFRDADTDAGHWACGSRHGHAIGGVGAAAVEDFSAVAGPPPIVVAEIAFDADVEFFQANGSSVDATVADIESILNAVNVIYQNDLGIRHRITAILVRETEDDPYDETDSNLLLDEFIEEWSSNQGTVVRDVAHLMTGKDLDQNIIGIAYIQQVCRLWAYGLSQSTFSASMPFRVALTAHELGHNWGARALHCDGEADCSIMCSIIGECSGNITSFGTMSVQDITNYTGFLLVYVGCLDLVFPQLELVPSDDCLQIGETMTVTLAMSDLDFYEAAGFQAFLSFDPTRLSFVTGSYTDSPFGVHILDPITAIGGEIDLAAEIDPAGGQTPTTENADLATLTFEALTEECGGTAVRFRSSPSPTEITEADGIPVSNLVTIDTPNVVIDGTVPEINCPGGITVSADAGGCDATLDLGTASATDNCDDVPAVIGTRSDSFALADPYLTGTTTITWRATDLCGNFQECQQQIDVRAVNELVVNVELSPAVESPITRCVTFELFECGGPGPVVLDQEITFTGGLATGVLVPVTCGDYECITAREKLHTLRRTDADDFIINGTVYEADFTDKSGVGGDDDSLLGGDLNGDGSINTYDFEVLNEHWSTNYGTQDPSCATASPHADISGDGLVFTGDFTFIQINYLESSDPGCCGASLLRRRPVTEVLASDLPSPGLRGEGYGPVATGKMPVPHGEPGLPGEGYGPVARDPLFAGGVATSTLAGGNVDLEWRPAAQTVFVGEAVNVGLYAVSDDPLRSRLLSAVDVILAWDPGVLQLMGVDDTGGAQLLSSGFPNDPFGLNEAVPPHNGEGLYQALANLGQPVEASPAGALITTFQFTAIAATPGTEVAVAAQGGSPVGYTVVWDATIPNTPVAGTLGAATVIIAAPGDFDGNGGVDQVDFIEFHRCLAGPDNPPGGTGCEAGDFDRDGDVDLDDWAPFQVAFSAPG